MKSSCSDETLGHLAYDTLETRREKHVYKLVKKCINGKMSQYFINYFTFNRDIVSRTTRHRAPLDTYRAPLDTSLVAEWATLYK